MIVRITVQALVTYDYEWDAGEDEIARLRGLAKKGKRKELGEIAAAHDALDWEVDEDTLELTINGRSLHVPDEDTP